MNLIELFDNLSLPSDFKGKGFYSTTIPGYANCRVAINSDGFPVLLLSIKNQVERIVLKNLRFKYIDVCQSVECKIFERDGEKWETFTVIYFKSLDRSLQEYFLRISESLVQATAGNPTNKQLVDSLNGFVEIFRALSDTPRKTVQGLWSELFVISISKKPDDLVAYWHNAPEEKFDFNSGMQRLEVKSSANFERIHFFSSGQLNPPDGVEVLVASLFVKRISSGLNIQDLVNMISDKINNLELIQKLNFVVARTLGNSLDEASKIRFDYSMARDSIKFYSHHSINKIEAVNIPTKVSEVCFKSDLSDSLEMDFSQLNQGRLFSSLI